MTNIEKQTKSDIVPVTSETSTLRKRLSSDQKGAVAITSILSVASLSVTYGVSFELSSWILLFNVLLVAPIGSMIAGLLSPEANIKKEMKNLSKNNNQILRLLKNNDTVLQEVFVKSRRNKSTETYIIYEDDTTIETYGYYEIVFSTVKEKIKKTTTIQLKQAIHINQEDLPEIIKTLIQENTNIILNNREKIVNETIKTKVVSLTKNMNKIIENYADLDKPSQEETATIIEVIKNTNTNLLHIYNTTPTKKSLPQKEKTTPNNRLDKSLLRKSEEEYTEQVGRNFELI